MQIVVVGYGAMGKIVASMLGEDLYDVVALECDKKNLNELSKVPDAIIDFSSPKNLDMIESYIKANGVPCVFATTGYTDEEEKRIEALKEYAPILRSSNFSLGVILLNRLVKEVTPILKDGYDIEIIEAHHNKKKDSPSGTAKMLMKSVVDATSYKEVNGRSGLSLRTKEEVGMHSIRGGTVVGEHEVLYLGEDEVLTLKHSAHSKRIFATGAIRGAKWLINKENGFYDMEDVLFGGK